MLCLDLTAGLGVPARVAHQVARELMGRGDTDFRGSLQVGSYVQLGADLSSLRDETQRRCAVAIESVVRRPRGRPRRRRDSTVLDLGDA